MRRQCPLRALLWYAAPRMSILYSGHAAKLGEVTSREPRRSGSSGHQECCRWCLKVPAATGICVLVCPASRGIPAESRRRRIFFSRCGSKTLLPVFSSPSTLPFLSFLVLLELAEDRATPPRLYLFHSFLSCRIGCSLSLISCLRSFVCTSLLQRLAAKSHSSQLFPTPVSIIHPTTAPARTTICSSLLSCTI
jgi:hypothetical protein